MNVNSVDPDLADLDLRCFQTWVNNLEKGMFILLLLLLFVL